MASITLLKRISAKADTTSSLETDVALIGGLALSAVNPAVLYTDANTSAITIGRTAIICEIAAKLQVDNTIIGPSTGAGIVIGAPGASSNTGSALQLASFTTTQQGNLAAAAGMEIFNTSLLTNGLFQNYNGKRWGDETSDNWQGSAADPAITNDNTQGYSTGSNWFNTTTVNRWYNKVSTTNLAIWSRDDYPNNFIQGLTYQYNNTLALMIYPGGCRDSTNSYNIELASQVVCNMAQSTAVNGILYDKTAAGTITLNNGSGSVAGVSTNFLTAFGTRALSVGTIGTGGSASTTITGTGTTFTSDIHIGDLIGASGGTTFASVTAVTSDTSLTVNSNLTIANGATGLVIENPTISSPTQTTSGRVTSIASATALTSSNTVWVNASAVQPYIGRQAANAWYYIWLVYGTSGVGTVVSTQRTNPTKHGATMWSGYTTGFRLLGAIWGNATPGIRMFSTWRGAGGRLFQNQGSANMVTSGAASAYTRFSWLDETAPAIADAVCYDIECQCVSGRAAGASSTAFVGLDGTTDMNYTYSGSAPTATLTNIGVTFDWYGRGCATNGIPAGPTAQGKGIPGAFYHVDSATLSIANLTCRGWSF